jgi:hypothetical protein
MTFDVNNLRPHSRIVLKLLDWLETRIDKPNSFLFVDDPAIDYPRPHKIGRSIPDIFAECETSKKIFIGEAKTVRDILPSHSKCQFQDYIKFLKRNENAFLLLGTERGYSELMEKVMYPLIRESQVNPSRINYVEL